MRSIDYAGGRLTPRQQHALELADAGHTTRKISEELGISVTTAQALVSKARRKIERASRKQWTDGLPPREASIVRAHFDGVSELRSWL